MADPKTYTQEEFDAMVQERDALKTSRDEVLKEKKRAADALKSYEGVDPTEYKTLKAAADEAAKKAALAEGNLEAWKKQVTDAHQKEREADSKRISKFESALDRRLKQDELRKALVGKVDPQYMDLLVEHGQKFIKVRETDDDFESFVADEKGTPLVGDGKGSPMTIGMFVDQTLKTKFPGAFLGTGSTGGGASKSTGGAGGSVRSIAAGDKKGFIDNLEAIAGGKVEVS